LDSSNSDCIRRSHNDDAGLWQVAFDVTLWQVSAQSDGNMTADGSSLDRESTGRVTYIKLCIAACGQ